MRGSEQEGSRERSQGDPSQLHAKRQRGNSNSMGGGGDEGNGEEASSPSAAKVREQRQPLLLVRLANGVSDRRLNVMPLIVLHADVRNALDLDPDLDSTLESVKHQVRSVV